MKEKRFEKVVEYKEERKPIKFNVKNRKEKIIMVFCFIILFPIIMLVTYLHELFELCQVKRKVTWREIK